MRRTAALMTVLAAGVLAAGPAWAAWIWRDEDKTWVYVEESEPPLSPPSARPNEATEESTAGTSAAEPADRPAPEPVQPSPPPKKGDDTPKPSPKPSPARPSAATATGKPESAQPAEKPATPSAVERTEPEPMPAPSYPAAATQEALETAEPADEPSAPKVPWHKRLFGAAPSPEKERRLYREAIEAFQAERYRRAEKPLRKLIDDYPQSWRRSEALFLLGECLFARKEYYKAYEQYEALIDQYAGSRHYQKALEREMQIAELYLGSAKRRVWGMPLLSGESEAIAILRRVYEHQPLGDLADDVVLKIADHYWEKRQWEEAEEYYDKYCREYPNVEPEKVRYAELRRAKCAIERCRGARYDTTCLNLAYDRLRQYQQKYPEQAKAEGVPELIREVRETLAEADYKVAKYYKWRGQDEAAAFYARRVTQQYGDTPWNEKAAKLLTKLDVEPQGQDVPQKAGDGEE